mmetsp:Transcript_85954/g.172061  ORF Transcript_85954/g.172061 Transcript_85954/m.172061 type:complete len:312 (+) Transcript_85954:1209-2144(+)
MRRVVHPVRSRTRSCLRGREKVVAAANSAAPRRGHLGSVCQVIVVAKVQLVIPATLPAAPARTTRFRRGRSWGVIVKIKVVAPRIAHRFSVVFIGNSEPIGSVGERPLERAFGDRELGPVDSRVLFAYSLILLTPVFSADNGCRRLEEACRGSARELLVGKELGHQGSKPLCVLRQAVGDRREVRKVHLPRTLEHLHALVHVSEVKRVVEAGHDILPNLSDFKHLSQLDRVSGDQVEEREAVEVFGHLRSLLHNLVVTLPKRLHAELVPTLVSELLHAFVLAQLVHRLHGDLNVPACQRQPKPSLEISHKV